MIVPGGGEWGRLYKNKIKTQTLYVPQISAKVYFPVHNVPSPGLYPGVGGRRVGRYKSESVSGVVVGRGQVLYISCRHTHLSP